MTKHFDNLGNFHNSFNIPSYLEYNEDSEFLEWYLVEGSERISEISRQLCTFLNLKNKVIRFRFSRPQKDAINPKNELVFERENKLFSSFFEYTSLVKKIRVKEGTLSEKIRILIEKMKVQPDSIDLKILKGLKYLGNEIWKNIHILSEFELHNHHGVLNKAIKIASILSSIEGLFYSFFSGFYDELKYNYLQLEKELSGLISLYGEDQFKIEKKKKLQVRILE
jgi:hypothetical protein